MRKLVNAWSALLFIWLLPLVAQAQTSFCGAEINNSMPPAFQTILKGDFLYLTEMQGAEASPAHKEIFHSDKISGAAYCQFIQSNNIKRISYDPKMSLGENCYYSIFTDEIFVGDQYFHTSRVQRLSSLFHEASHATVPTHTYCPSPFLDEKGEIVRGVVSKVDLSGLKACDEKGDGAYGVEAVWLSAVATSCTSCGYDMRQEAALLVPYSLIRILDPLARESLIQKLKPSSSSP